MFVNNDTRRAVIGRNFNDSLLIYQKECEVVIGFDFEAYLINSHRKVFNLPKVQWVGFIDESPKCGSDIAFKGCSTDHTFMLHENNIEDINSMVISVIKVKKLTNILYLVNSNDAKYLCVMQ